MNILIQSCTFCTIFLAYFSWVFLPLKLFFCNFCCPLGLFWKKFVSGGNWVDWLKFNFNFQMSLWNPTPRIALFVPGSLGPFFSHPIYQLKVHAHAWVLMAWRTKWEARRASNSCESHCETFKSWVLNTALAPGFLVCISYLCVCVFSTRKDYVRWCNHVIRSFQ